MLLVDVDCPLEDAAGEDVEPLEGEGADGVVKARRKRSGRVSISGLGEPPPHAPHQSSYR